MARDEALLESVGAGESPPTLRFYSWSPATISIGYVQEIAEFERLPPPAGSLPVVRRATGGGAILHDGELTYSIVLPISHGWVGRRPNDLYERIHSIIRRATGDRVRLFRDMAERCDPAVVCGESARRGPFFCFARRHALDLVTVDPAGPGGCSKLAGSAQRRTRQVVLQHGSIILTKRYEQQPCAAWSALGGPATTEQAIERLLSVFQNDADVKLSKDLWRDEEFSRVEQLRAVYAGEDWTHHGLRPETAGSASEATR